MSMNQTIVEIYSSLTDYELGVLEAVKMYSPVVEMDYLDALKVALARLIEFGLITLIKLAGGRSKLVCLNKGRLVVDLSGLDVSTSACYRYGRG